MKEDPSEYMSSFNGSISVTPTHLDLGYQGYAWRIIIRADQELEMLSSLRDPSAEAITLREVRNIMLKFDNSYLCSYFAYDVVYDRSSVYTILGIDKKACH